jgi:hypothetical protein
MSVPPAAWRCDRLEVAGVREEREHRFGRGEQVLLAGEDVDCHIPCTRRGTVYAQCMAEDRDEPDLVARQGEIAAAMDETKRRQDEIQRRQDELLDHLQRLSRALDPDDGPEPPRDA